jgi:2-keto-4-pentenoate hydratase/2-oxohepta-3-ene-1,7-dioic acid hydratase in catechol pathway
MNFTLASIKHNHKHLAAVRVKDRFWPLLPACKMLGVEGLPSSLAEVFENWTGLNGDIRRIGAAIESGEISDEISLKETETELSIPLEYPRKVFCVGANYADHLAEMGATMEKVAGRSPFFFMKPPTTNLAGPGKTVFLPPGCKIFDWEVEVVIVFGRGGRHISLESALDHVAGYTLGIDFTARDQFFAPHLPFKFDFILGKCQDRTTPIGPVIVPKEFVNIEDIHFTLSVNGIKKQDSSTSKMIYSLAEQISGISKAVRIEAGDILFTGSPAGIGAPKGESLRAGDRVVVQSDLTGPMEVIIQPPQNEAGAQL